jgi:mycofactocin precursor
MDENVAVLVEAAEPTSVQAPDQGTADQEMVDELLVEEVSIDGMCGVY